MSGNVMATPGAGGAGSRRGSSLIPPGEGAQGRGEQPGQRQVGGHPGRAFGQDIGLSLPVESFARAAEDFVANPSF